MYGITIDKNNRVITSETFPGRVQVFRYVTDAEAVQAKKEQADQSHSARQRQAEREPRQPAGAKFCGALAATSFGCALEGSQNEYGVLEQL